MMNTNWQIACTGMDPGRVYLNERFESVEQSTHHNVDENNWYIYHSDHLGSSAFLTDPSGTPTQHLQYLQYLPFGEPFIEQRSVTEYYTPYTFSAKERDLETGYSYFGARYYDATLSIWLSVDPMAHARSWLSPYNYCLQNPIGRIDMDGNLCGDYYDTDGNWLGSDGVVDNKAYVAVSRNSDGTFNNARELPISNSELLDRATWVYGESGGSGEIITSRTQNAGDASTVANARVVDYYAFAIQNAVRKLGGFQRVLEQRMRKEVDGKIQPTYEGYFQGTGIGGNPQSKRFAQARMSGMEELMEVPRANNAISAVIKSVTSTSDPTGGARAWLGRDYARRYVNDANRKFSSDYGTASHQFSFSSGNGSFFHTFFRIGR
jgi:RHS repeat-associated protein